LRLGTPAITRRGFGIVETKALTGWICDILDDINNEDTISKVQASVKELCARFPVYA
jgi:glycine hydroxymethyltransferase